jgi:hypothetical protein
MITEINSFIIGKSQLYSLMQEHGTFMIPRVGCLLILLSKWRGKGPTPRLRAGVLVPCSPVTKAVAGECPRTREPAPHGVPTARSWARHPHENLYA